jgi:hypothetical protein
MVVSAVILNISIAVHELLGTVTGETGEYGTLWPLSEGTQLNQSHWLRLLFNKTTCLLLIELKLLISETFLKS